MIPPNLQEQHFLQAADQMDRVGIPPGRKPRRYVLRLRGRTYPLKYMISLACKIATGNEHPADCFTSYDTRSYFGSRGYEVIDLWEDPPIEIAPEDDQSAFPEGQESYRTHRSRERDSSIVKRAKEQRLRNTDSLRCEVCSLDFNEMYGCRGAGFIEAHHTVPVADLDGETKTRISDIALVCSNCHRMLHRKILLSVEDLREIVKNRSPTSVRTLEQGSFRNSKNEQAKN